MIKFCTINNEIIYILCRNAFSNQKGIRIEIQPSSFPIISIIEQPNESSYDINNGTEIIIIRTADKQYSDWFAFSNKKSMQNFINILITNNEN